MQKCIYQNEQWLIYNKVQDAYIILQEVGRNAFGIQYKRTIVNKKEIILK